jgi:hypothetical protein
MRPELEHSLRKADLGKYLIKAAEADTSIEDALEQGFQEGVMREREHQLTIDRVGGKEALEAANALSAALKRVKAR